MFEYQNIIQAEDRYHRYIHPMTGKTLMEKPIIVDVRNRANIKVIQGFTLLGTFQFVWQANQFVQVLNRLNKLNRK